MPKKQVPTKNLVLYKAPNGDIELRGDFGHETIWATQDQISQLFSIERSVVTKHIRNIYKEGELVDGATSAKFAQVRIEGKRQVQREIEYYNLDVIISVGYRVNSKQATQFRQWATKTLKQYLLEGYVLNKKQIKKNHQAFLKSIADIQTLLPEHVTLDPKAILDLVKEFAGTWQSLDAYDKETLRPIGTTKKAVQFSATELTDALQKLQKELMKKGEATDLFATERSQGSLEGIVGNVMQSFAGKSVYATNEEKAAHLLYFVIKNHPFLDGNKRSGAFAFVWFLRKARVKGYANINPSALTALTLLIAESEPKRKDQMTALVTTLLVGKVK
jgi:prophage maintenance system killer protein